MTRSTSILFNRVLSVMIAYMIVLLLFVSCSGDGFTDSNKPLHQNGSIVIRAERFSLEKRSGYTKLTINNPWQGARGISQIYYLVKRGSEIPSGIDLNNTIMVPLKKIICMSTTQLAMISALNEEKTISGVSGAVFIYGKPLSDKVKNGRILDIGYEADLNKELIIRLSPDLIMMYGIGSESLGYINKIEELGIKTIFNADYLEIDPLGKAEWIKLFGALYCKDEMADSIFRSVSEKYLRIKDFISGHTRSRPNVLLGLPYKDTWFISPGNSYISTIIGDAEEIIFGRKPHRQSQCQWGLKMSIQKP